MQKHSKNAMCRLRRHGVKSERMSREGSHAQKLHVRCVCPIFVVGSVGMKIYAS